MNKYDEIASLDITLKAKLQFLANSLRPTAQRIVGQVSVIHNKALESNANDRMNIIKDAAEDIATHVNHLYDFLEILEKLVDQIPDEN